MNFSSALHSMINSGQSCARKLWNGTASVQAQIPDSNSKMTIPYLYISGMVTGNGNQQVPWTPDQVDLFADDWAAADKV